MSVHAGGRGMGHVSRLVRLGPVASLRLNLLSGTWLDPRITFSRGSQAMVTDATGELTYAPNNLLTNSESFEAAAWTKSNATITANASTAPDGTTTADAFIENTTASVTHDLAQAQSVTAGTIYTSSVYIKAIGSRTAMLILSGAFTESRTWFNLSTLTATTTVGSIISSSITSLGNGWFRCSITQAAATTGSGTVSYRLWNGTTASYTGDGTSGIYLWGAQLEAVTYQTTPSPYVSTTPKNLLGYTQEFDNAAWIKTRASITANAIVAPDGTLTGDKLVEDTTASNNHITYQYCDAPASNSTVTASIYVKAAERGFAQIRLMDNAADVNGGRNQYNIAVDLSDGSVGTTYSVGSPINPSYTVINAGGGWWRCSLTLTKKGDATRTDLYVYPWISNNADANPTYTGDGTSGIYIWGAQLSNSASVDPYVYNPVAAPSSTAYYGPRFDYDPVTLAPKGLLIEEQRTNLLTYSEQFDNAAWAKVGATVTGSKLIPNNTVALASSWISQAVAKAASATTYTYRVRATAAEFNRVLLLVADTASAANRAQVTVSLTNGSVVAAAQAVGTFSAASVSVVAAGSSYDVALTFTTSTETSITGRIYAADSVATTGNGTSGITVVNAQLEAGAFATSYIPTVASTVTRSADVARMQGANFSNWYNQSEGTFVVEADTAGIVSSGGGRIVAATEGTVENNVTAAILSQTRNGGVFVAVGGTTQAQTASVSAAAIDAVFKLSAAYKLNDCGSSFNGEAVVLDRISTIPTNIDRLTFGDRPASGRPLNGHIRSISYYNTRLPNQQLQALTS